MDKKQKKNQKHISGLATILMSVGMERGAGNRFLMEAYYHSQWLEYPRGYTTGYRLYLSKTKYEGFFYSLFYKKLQIDNRYKK